MYHKVNTNLNNQSIINKNTHGCTYHCCHYSSSDLNNQCSMLATKKLNHIHTTRDTHFQRIINKKQDNMNAQNFKSQCINHNIQSLSLLESRGTSNSRSKKKSHRLSVEKCVECLSNQSCSRQKCLQNRINHMLKQQQSKIVFLTNGYGNKINFLNTKAFLQNQMMKDKYIDKQNQFNPNKIYNLDSKRQQLQTQKSNKLTLRNYINTTPAQTESSVNSFDNSNQVMSNEIRRQKKSQQSRIQSQNERLTPLKSMHIKNSQVLKQVRQIKDMFLELLNKKQESKTEKKSNNFIKTLNLEQKQTLTLQQ